MPNTYRSELVLVVVWTLLVGACSHSTSCTCDPKDSIDDCTALCDFFIATNQRDELAPFGSFTGWANGTSLCTWPGVACTDNRVTSLVLDSGMSAFQFSGSIKGQMPNSIGRLTKLKTLSIMDFVMNGAIPSSIGELTQLETLRIACRLSGTIPSSIGQLTALKSLDFNNNGDLIGAIPASLGNLALLTSLQLLGNQLNGSIPESLRQLKQLSEFDLSENKLTGDFPGWIAELTELTGLSIDRNEISGRIPDTIGQLTKLQRLEVEHNKLTALPDAICPLVKEQLKDCCFAFNPYQEPELPCATNPQCETQTCGWRSSLETAMVI